MKTQPSNSTMDVLRLLFEKQPMDQTGVARHLSITRAAINLHFLELAAEHYIRPIATQSKGRGRPAHLWELDPQYNLFMGIAIENGTLQSELIDCQGGVVDVQKETYPADISFELLHQRIFAQIKAFQKLAEAREAQIRQCFLASPGRRLEDGTILQVVNLPILNGWNPDRDIEQTFGIPTFNDAFHTPTLQGASEEDGANSTMALLNWDDGFSAIFSSNGRQIIWPDPSPKRVRALWDVGHLCIEPNGRLCRCGKHGCLEAYVGGLALAQMHPELGCADSRELAQCAMAGNAAAANLLRQAVGLVMRTLYTTFELFGVDTIVFVNTMAAAFPCFEEAAWAELAKFYPAEELKLLTLRHSPLTEDKLRHGSALTARQVFFYPEKFLPVRGMHMANN